MAHFTPTKVTYSVDGGKSVEADCDLLVVACDPRGLSDIGNFSSEEKAIFDDLKNYTFHTTLVKVPVPSDAADKVKFGVILKPEAIDHMDGTVSGYRNESAKQFSLETANGMSENLVTVYQIQGPVATPWTNEQFLQNLKDTLQTLDWWPYDSFEICTDDQGTEIALTTPYFDHFENEGLTSHMPWKYLGVQGTGNTLYVHGSTCFESVLQCWQFGGLLLDNLAHLGIQLPDEKEALIVVLGAGPSGMLFAHRLQCMGYTNVQILESTARFGGKTHTVTLDAPSPDGTHKKTACELGTCYMSPAYDDMADELKDFLVDNDRHGFWVNASHENPNKLSFRGMVTADQFDGVDMPDAVIAYGDYVGLKGYYEANKPFPDPAKWREGFDPVWTGVSVGVALTKYLLLVEYYVGSNMPMPTSAPQALLDKNYDSFYDFLEDHDLLILTGLLEYAYSVQGYGPLKKIPVYYGMIWISVPLTKAIIKAAVEGLIGIDSDPTVTVLSKGWLNLWDQMEPTLKVTLNVDVTSIERPI